MSARKIQTHIRRDQIAQAVLALISRHGLKGLSVARVAAQVGLVPSALYRHFRGKEEMVDAALQIIRRKILGNVRLVRAATDDPWEQLRRLSRETLAITRENQAIPRIIFSEDAVVDQPGRKRLVRRLIQTFVYQIQEIITAGQAAGRIRPELDARAAALLFLGLIQPAAVLFYLHDGKYDSTGHLEKVWDLFRRAVGGDPLPSGKATPRLTS